MRRREFTIFLGGFAAWPFDSRAQPIKSATIGFLGANTAAAQKRSTAALLLRLRELGWVEGRNLAVEYRWAEGRYDRSPALVAELVERKVDVIVTHALANVVAAKKATADMPIVFAAVGDPVRVGLVASLARPGGNITGLSLQSVDVVRKRLELLRELLPATVKVAVVGSGLSPTIVHERQEIQDAARLLGVEILIPEIGAEMGLAAALAALPGKVDALFVQTDPMTYTHRSDIKTFAQKARLPAIFGVREFAEEGGLMSYGPSFVDLFRRAGDFVDKILRGAKPGDLPVEQPTKFELVINLKTAQSLALTIPPSLLARADEVIE